MLTSTLSSFTDLQVQAPLITAINRMGITTPTPIQSSVIPAMLQGKDVIGQARTGSGKTLAYAIPLVSRCDPAVRGVQALVLAPTRELAIQIGEVMTQVARPRQLRVALLYGGRSLEPEQRALAGGAQIIVATPGRTLDHLKRGTLSLKGVRLFVLDEGDEMLDRGFGPDVERILSQTPTQRQTAIFSATIPEWVTQAAARYMREPAILQVDAGMQAPPEIEHIVYEIDPTRKFGALRTLLDRQGPNPIIVFGRTKHGVKKLARQLEELGYPVAALQGNLSQNARQRVMEDFRAGRVRTLLATNVAARGLDIDDVEQVINYELPETGELLTHRIGRTGRMGRSGEAITFLTPEDSSKWRQIERTLGRRLAIKPWPGAADASRRFNEPVAPSAANRPQPRAQAAAPANRPEPRTQAAVPVPAPSTRPQDQRNRPFERRRGSGRNEPVTIWKR